MLTNAPVAHVKMAERVQMDKTDLHAHARQDMPELLAIKVKLRY
jgi:hypothetical protein